MLAPMTNDFILNKKELRKEMQLKRVQIDPLLKNNYDAWICKQLEEMILAKNCKVVHAYLPMEHEIDIAPLLHNLLEKKITVVTSKTFPKRKLVHLVLNELNEIEKGLFGTTHPANSLEYKGTYDFIIVPGLAFDMQNFRLGYGGGYYDNFLVRHPKAYKTGICYPFQKVASVPTESHDIRLDTILSKDF